jgi:radical S-adenosyl methionine domain-containing protein 2
MIYSSLFRSSSQRVPLTENLHFIKECNYQCKFCFATFNDISSQVKTDKLSYRNLKSIVDLVASKFTKITFAGGEPLLYPNLTELMHITKTKGALVNIVTNGSLLTYDWLKTYSSIVDFLTISCDSDNPKTLINLGRCDTKGKTMMPGLYIGLANFASSLGIKVKLNTVVTTINENENISKFVRFIEPCRWKILQAMPIEGQNNKYIKSLVPSIDKFRRYVERNSYKLVGTNIRVVPETIDDIQSSYIMVDPRGKFFDDTFGYYRYSRSILDVGIDEAWKDMSYNIDKFKARGGTADFD